ncbi:MAG: hypothetical protein JW726_02130 [Anaerolineales bacterium]|nr:hypothetical protein [Anaerolineales bacterium]
MRKIAWLETDPQQCASNPWEQEWVGLNVEERCQAYSECSGMDGLQWATCAEDVLVRGFYALEGVEVYETRRVDFEDKFGQAIAICEGCACPAGYTLYVQVDDGDVSRMLELGFRTIVADCSEATPQLYGCGAFQP